MVTTRIHCVYDAWNRLVEVRADNSGDPGALIAEYSYDGLNRRIEKQVAAGSVDTHYYYNGEWQMLEERQVDGTGTTIESNDYVWSARYIDSPIVRFHDDNGDGDLLDTGDNTHYYTTDANHNVTAVIDTSTGNVVTYYAYTPYGEATAYDAAWSNPAAPTEDGPLYCGYFFDAESDNYLARHRYYGSSLGTWINRDPAESGSNLYEYCLSNPVVYVDSTGAVPMNAADPTDPLTNIINYAMQHRFGTRDRRGCVTMTLAWYRYIAEQVFHYPLADADMPNNWLRGCIGYADALANALGCQTTNGKPESIPNARCFATTSSGAAAAAANFACPTGYKKLQIVKQGRWKKTYSAGGQPLVPVPKKDGEVPCDSVVGVRSPGDFNYITNEGSYWVYMNHCREIWDPKAGRNGTGAWRCATSSDPPNAPENPKSPQKIVICPQDPTPTLNYPVSIYIVGCCPDCR